MLKLQDLLFLAAGSAALAWTYSVMRSAGRLAGGVPKSPHRRIHRPVAFPTDSRLRDDVGLPPLAVEQPPLRLRPARRQPAYFPADDRLRDDIGLPPLDADS